MRPRALYLLLLLLVPLLAGAQEIPGGSIIPDIDDGDQNLRTCAAGWKAIIIMFGSLTELLLYVAILIATVVIVYAGILFVFNSTNPENLSKGKKILGNAAVGLLIALAAWLIVNTVLTGLGAGDIQSRTSAIGTGGSICITIQPPKSDIPTGQAIGTGPSRTAGGTCTVPSNDNNPCSVKSLSNTCFAANGANASKVCMVESAGGRVDIESGSDRLNGGAGPSYSIGLWQINLTNTKLRLDDGTVLNCPAAFVGLRNPSNSTCGGGSGNKTGPSKLAYCTVGIKDQALYNRCVAAAKQHTVNTRAACDLYDDSRGSSIRGLQPWQNSSIKCNVPYTGM